MFSSQGYPKTFASEPMEDILIEIFEIGFLSRRVNENTIKMVRALNGELCNYFFAIWGNPAEDEIWGLRILKAASPYLSTCR